MTEVRQVTHTFGPKGTRFLIKAVKHYIGELEHFRDTVDEENQHWFDNDIALYRSLLVALTAGVAER